MKKKGFTLIELIGVLVILAIIALIVTPLVISIIRKAKLSARKRSVDAYGRSVELAIASYLLDTGTFPTNEQLPNLQIEYSGSNVVCNIMAMKENGGLYLSECKVNNVEVKDSSTEDGYYHYGTRDLTNEEYVDMYGKAIEQALKNYHDINNTYPADISSLKIDYTGKKINCDTIINPDGTVYLTKCSVNNKEVLDDNSDDNYYHYGKLVRGTDVLLKKVNDISITDYTDGDIHEMYTFSHPATEQTGALTDYRYIGNDPYNYVTFNNELWRIVGLFTVEDENGQSEQRIKIVKDEKLEDGIAWDLNNINEWSTSNMNSYLNGDYYNSLTSDAKSMIADTKYYLGGIAQNNNFSVPQIYASERGTTVYNQDNITRSINWVSKIALLYPSDFFYTYAYGVNDSCYNEAGCNHYNSGNKNAGWIFNTKSSEVVWYLTPSTSYPFYVNYLTSDGVITCYYGVKNTYGVHPVLYLKSSVIITAGDGSSDSPYQLSM